MIFLAYAPHWLKLENIVKDSTVFLVHEYTILVKLENLKVYRESVSTIEAV